MKINDDHMYHGAALTQIAEHRKFASINVVKNAKRVGGISQAAFRINGTIGIYLKYATKPTPPNEDYVFNFSRDAKEELRDFSPTVDKTFIALICIEDRQICCMSYCEFLNWIHKREKKRRNIEDTSTILVSLPRNKSFRVNMNEPGKRGHYLANPQTIPRNRFPKCLFE